MPNIKAIIFDFGGPIMTWDDEPVYRKHEDHRNLERDTLKKLLTDYLVGGAQGKYDSLQHYMETERPSISMTTEEVNEVLDEANATMRIIPEQIEYIQELKKKYKIGLLSNFTTGLPEFLKDVFNIYHLFDAVVSSYEVKVAKPDPRIYEHALEQLGVRAEEAVFTDDKEENVRAAEAIGMKGIVFVTFPQFRSDLEKLLSKA